MNAGVIVAIVLGGLVFIYLLTIFFLLPKKAYFTAMFSKSYIGMFYLISMKMRKVDVWEIVNAYILAKKSHLGVTLHDLEMVFVGSGHPMKVVEGMNAAHNANMKMSFEYAKAVDIAGREVVEVVRECVNPKVIELPLISSVAQDNREVNAKISLTLKINVSNFLKGVTEETISARATEAVVTKIANTPKASMLVAQPQLIDKAIFDAEIDSDSKYTLVSADVIHADLGINRGFSAEKDQIEKNRIIVANQMEKRRLEAVAEEQEMKVRCEQARLQLIEEEMEVPRAVAQAIKEGKMKDVVDYYKLQNLQADTEMRRRLFGKTDNQTEG